MKKNILVILSVLIIIILVGCQKKEEVSTYEQDRVVQYILDNVELVDGNEIKKIEFLRFERPDTTARSWWIRVELNSKYQTYLTEGALGGELRFSGFYAEEISIRKQEKRTIDKNNIEIIYVKGKQ